MQQTDGVLEAVKTVVMFDDDCEKLPMTRMMSFAF